MLCRFTLAIFLATVGNLAQSGPLFPNSVVSNDIDFIKSKDPSAYHCTKYLGTARKEMPDKRRDELMADGNFTFVMNFSDGTQVEIWVHPDNGSKTAAKRIVDQLRGPLGHLPSVMRQNLSHVVVHKGDETAFAEDQGRFFVLYSGNMKRRIGTHDLEETVFHESVHATLDAQHVSGRAWKKAVRRDKGHITEYGANLPKEDLAESALFFFALLSTPGRLPRDIAEHLTTQFPNRHAFFTKLFVESGPRFQKVGPISGC